MIRAVKELTRAVCVFVLVAVPVVGWVLGASWMYHAQPLGWSNNAHFVVWALSTFAIFMAGTWIIAALEERDAKEETS